jgi:hypothetical protein
MMNESRLILIEFIREDPYRNFRAEMYPFFKGLCLEKNVPVQWAVFGLNPEEYQNNPFIIDLSRDNCKKIIEIFNNFKPSHVIFNEKLNESTDSQIKKIFPDFRITNLAEAGQGEKIQHNISSFTNWLGISHLIQPAENQSFPGNITPEYMCFHANEPASEFQKFIKILCGQGCLYRKSLLKNKYFKGVDLSHASRAYGCSFCGDFTADFHDESTDLDAAVSQIKAAVRSLKTEIPVFSFMITGSAVFLKIDRFFEKIFSLDMPQSEFYFSCRADEFLSRAKKIHDLLPGLRRRSFSIHLHNMGVENFSRAENERFNKGISNKQVLDAFRTISRMEKKYPETISFHEHGGFAFILFTPWTTLEDLEINLKMADKINLPPDSFFFRSRLQLMENRPITLLAEKHGLIADSFKDMDFDSGCITNWDQKEIPWRFKNPEISVIYYISSRWGVRETEIERQETGYRKIQELRSSFPAPCQDISVIFSALIEIFKKHKSGLSVDEVLNMLGKEAERIAAHTRKIKRRISRTKPDPAALGETIRRVQSFLGLINTNTETCFSIAGNPSLLNDGTVQISFQSENRLVNLGFTAIILESETMKNITDIRISCFMIPSKGTQGHRKFVRILASLLNCFNSIPANLKKRNDFVRLILKGSPLIETVEHSVFPADGQIQNFNGFEPFWPVLLNDGRILFSMRTGKDRIDLYLEEKGKSDHYFMATEKAAISYYNSAPVDTPLKADAVRKFAEQLKIIERNSRLTALPQE